MERLINLWSRIDSYMSNNEYYDDDEEITVCEVTEEETYLAVVKQEDIKFLGAKVIKEEIHKFFSDDKYRREKLIEHKLF